MTRHFLKMAPRYYRLQFEKAVGKSIPKIITELITNSDDSYKRMAKMDDPRRSKERFGKIRIVANRRKRTIRVVDQAQGISKDEMEEKFVWYGQESEDRAKGMQTRSLFGKGLRDVLFTQKVGIVRSIKDGVSYTAKFHWSKPKDAEMVLPAIDTRRGPRVNKDLRTHWGISENGTFVEFKLRGDVSFPRHETILERISNFYMLRMINNNPKRKVTLTSIDKSRKETTDIVQYTFPTGDIITKKTLVMKYENVEFPIELELYRSKVSLIQGGLGYEEREGGLLVLDKDNNVLDLTLFSFDKDPSASRLYGILRIIGAGRFIREKLNASPPEPILSEEREGLIRSRQFYRTLAKLIDPILEPIVKEEEKLQRSSKGQFSPETLARYKDAIEILNRLYRELVGKPLTGDGFHGKKPFMPDFISFARPQITITKDVVTPVALLINCNTISNATEIGISSDNSTITVSPERFSIDHSSAKEGLLIKILHVIGVEIGVVGKISANALEHRSSIVVSVVEKDVFYPRNGIEFHPYQMHLRDGKKKKLHLYIDTKKIPVGSIVDFKCNSIGFKLSVNRIQFQEDMKVSADIGHMSVGIRGHGIGQEAIVEAVAKEYRATASVMVVSKDEERKRIEHGGRFRPPEFMEIPNLKVQTWLRPTDGTILINLLDPVNKAYFGDDPHTAVETKLHCQLRLADLVLDECLNEIVSHAWGRSLPRRFPNNPEVDIRLYVAEKKFEIGFQVHKHFVTIESEK